jgi:hypothetical protein
MVGNRRQFLGFAIPWLWPQKARESPQEASMPTRRSTRCRLASGDTRATTGWS